MSRIPFTSLRGRLFVLVLIAVIPALGLILYTAAEQRQVAEANVQVSALRVARLVAAEHERLTDGAWQLLITLTHLPEVRGNSPAACNSLLAELLEQYPQYTNLGVATPQGEVFCSAVPVQNKLDLSDRPDFTRAIRTRDLVVEPYQIDPITGKPTVSFTYALRDEAGKVQRVVFTGLDLAWLNQLVTESQLPEGAILIVVDRNGTILVHRPNPESWVGKTLPQEPLVRTILSQDEGTADLRGMDKVDRLYAFTPLKVVPDTGMYVGIGISKDTAFTEANWILGRQLIGLGVVFLLALAAAWLGGEVFVLRRIKALLVATRRLERGDWTARTGLRYGKGELSELARAFDQMTGVLEQREIERQQLEKETRRYNRNLAALNVVVSAVSSSLEIPEILANLKRELAEQLDVPGGVIFFYSEAADRLYLEVAWGIPPAILAEFKNFPANAFHYKAVIQDREAVLIPDFKQETPYAQSGLPSARPDWQSYLCVPLLAKGEVQGVLDLFSKAPVAFNQDQVALFTTLGQQVGVIIQNARLFAQVRTGRQRLQMLSQQLLEVQEAERRHISRELHDEVGQALTAVKVNLQAVLRSSDNSSLSSHLEESITIIERVLQQVRNLSLDLRPSLLDDLGVVSALRWYIDRQGQRAGFKTEFIAEPVDLRLPTDMETVCFRVVQEALTNVVRHALASQVQVRLTRREDSLELVIRDDGVGFDVGAVRERAAGDTSLGILGMQERVQLIGGQIEIRSNSDRGTEIRAIFPLTVTPVY